MVFHHLEHFLESKHKINSQYYRGSQLVETKSNEIPAVRQLLERVEVAGSLIGIDALHTQQETARQVVQEAGADYLLTVKANQKKLRQTLAQKLPKPEQLFSPSRAVAAGLGPHGATAE